MELKLSGHAFRYAAEQALLSFLPERAEGSLESVLSEDGLAAEAVLTADGRTLRGHAADPGPLPEEKLLRERLQQRLVKLSIYEACIALTGTEPPWGALTGVRPGKLAARLLLSGETPAETALQLQREYRVNAVRAGLCTQAAEAGIRAKAVLEPKDIILYVGIPFCPTRCAYCSFVSHSVEKSLKLVEPYVEALCGEIDAIGALCEREALRVRAVYFGGGTPTTLSEEQLRRVLGRLETAFDLSHNTEYTVEAGRPDTVTRGKLEALRDFGVGRISINPQTMDDRVLQAIGRRHTVGEILEAYALAREVFPGSINMDLIAGLPEESEAGFTAGLEQILRLDPENITVHTLTRKRGADMNALELRAAEGETVGHMLGSVLDRLPQAGYAPYYLYRQKFSAGGYENVGWAKPGTECLYNVAMMEELCSVMSLGAGGATKRMLPGGKILRCFNKKYPYEYIGSVRESTAEKEKLFGE